MPILPRGRLLCLWIAVSACCCTCQADEPETEKSRPKTPTEYYAPASPQSLGSEYKSSHDSVYQATYVPDGDYRQPVDVEFIDEHQALVTTKLTGQIYVFDLRSREFSLAHHDPNCSWGEIIQLQSDVVAVCERNAEQVVIFSAADNHWSPVCRLDAFGQPQSLAWDAAAGRLYATGLWSQRLYRWDVLGQQADRGATRWQALPPIDLGMAGGEVLVLPRHQLVMVTDAFGRNYRLLDRHTGEVVKRDKVYGHNITSLVAVADQEMVLFPHQLLNEHAQSVQTDITWGGLMSNNLRWLKVERLLQHTGQEIFKQGRFYPLGAPGNGSGDPTSLSVASNGKLAITLGGTNRVTIGNDGDYYFRQLAVGYHPVACQFTPDESQLIVVNQFSDSVSLINLANDHVEHFSIGKLREPTQLERGEQAFFNSRLAHDGWMSCHSCHSQGHTNGQLNDNMTDHSFGTPKRVLSLLGQKATMPYSWGGDMPDLEAQVAHSIASTMASDSDVEPQTVADLATYVRSLAAPPSLIAARQPQSQRGQAHTADDMAGRQLFKQLGCADCHAGKWRTSPQTYDVGLSDEDKMRQFNPPSLISVSQRQNNLFHDGRASSLRDVLQEHKHQLPRELSPLELSQLVQYLEAL